MKKFLQFSLVLCYICLILAISNTAKADINDDKKMLVFHQPMECIDRGIEKLDNETISCYTAWVYNDNNNIRGFIIYDEGLYWWSSQDKEICFDVQTSKYTESGYEVIDEYGVFYNDIHIWNIDDCEVLENDVSIGKISAN